MTDWSGVAQVITACGVLLTALLSGLAMILAAQSKKQSAETHSVVNSRMDEFKKLFEETFRMKGAADERAAGRERAAAVADATGISANTTAATLVAAAELKARSLIEEATLAAAKLLAEAHKVSITNPTDNPVLVKVVGPGVDEPLKVTDVKGKK